MSVSKDGKLSVLTFKKEGHPEGADYLEALAKGLREGSVRSVGVAFECDDGSMGSHAFYAEGSYPVKMVGELEVLKAQCVAMMLNGMGRDP